MTEYKNLGSDSGIVAYEIFEQVIHILFDSNMVYEYTYLTPGVTDVENMKSLAIKGEGLNEYINKNVKSRFARKWGL